MDAHAGRDLKREMDYVDACEILHETTLSTKELEEPEKYDKIPTHGKVWAKMMLKMIQHPDVQAAITPPACKKRRVEPNPNDATRIRRIKNPDVPV